MPKSGKTKKKRGRPPTGGRDPSITVRLPAALIQWVDGEAKAQGSGRSEMIRRLIDESRLGVVRTASIVKDLQRVRSSVVEQPGSAGKDGGSIPARPLQIIKTDEANKLIDGRHYLGGVEYTPRFCIATAERDAVAIYSPPVASHFKMVADFKPLELARLWQSDKSDRPLSQFLASSLRWLRKLAPEVDCVFSYADPARSHSLLGTAHRGTIYKAANFAYIGASRATDYWRTPQGELISSTVCYRRFQTKSRIKIQALNPKWKLIPGKPKLLYVYGLRRTPDEVRQLIQGRYADAATSS